MTGFFQKELSSLRQELIKMGRAVEINLGKASDALAKGDVPAAEDVIAEDKAINEMENTIINRTILLLATNQPVAGDLRFLTSCLRLAVELERIGDQATNLGRRTVALGGLETPRPLPDDMFRLMKAVRGMLEAALDALVSGDQAICNAVVDRDDEVDELYHTIKESVIAEVTADGAKAAWGLEVINAASNMERLGDHSVNIAEEVVYMVRGHRAPGA